MSESLMSTPEGRALVRSLKAVRRAKQEARSAKAPASIINATLALDRAIRDEMVLRDIALGACSKAPKGVLL